MVPLVETFITRGRQCDAERTVPLSKTFATSPRVESATFHLGYGEKMPVFYNTRFCCNMNIPPIILIVVSKSSTRDFCIKLRALVCEMHNYWDGKSAHGTTIKTKMAAVVCSKIHCAIRYQLESLVRCLRWGDVRPLGSK